MQSVKVGDHVRFKTRKEINADVCHNDPQTIRSLCLILHRGPYIYTTKVFKVIEICKRMCVIENIFSHKRHRVFKEAVKKI